jgi:8-oxo-dGTP pyrophosphatase MutT (NUDIX family)
MLKPAQQSRPQAAVALIQCNHPEPAWLLLRRAHHPLDPWSGHWAFPGGRCEKEDQDPLDTCIRETFEECNISLRRTDMVKMLGVHIAGSSMNKILPVAVYFFVLERLPVIKLNPLEMADFFWLKIADFKNPKLHATFRPHAHLAEFPCLNILDYPLWGFSYGVLLEHCETIAFF